MRETTKSHIRKQGSTIDGIVGSLQILAETNLMEQAAIQKRLVQLGAMLNTVSDRLIEIEHSESLEWIEDKAGVDA